MQFALRYEFYNPLTAIKDNGPPGQDTSRPDGMSLASAALDALPGTVGEIVSERCSVP
jgi:hypothetical protein